MPGTFNGFPSGGKLVIVATAVIPVRNGASAGGSSRMIRTGMRCASLAQFSVGSILGKSLLHLTDIDGGALPPQPPERFVRDDPR
jgi:hypothetical protein